MHRQDIPVRRAVISGLDLTTAIWEIIMKNKILAIMLALAMMLAITACTDKTSDDSTAGGGSGGSVTTEDNSVLAKLEDEGWTLTEAGYELTEENDYCDIHIIAAMDGEKLSLKLDYEYVSGGDSIKNIYADDDSVAAANAAAWFTKLTSLSGADTAGVKYEINVDGELVGEGELSADEAAELTAEYGD